MNAYFFYTLIGFWSPVVFLRPLEWHCLAWHRGSKDANRHPRIERHESTGPYDFPCFSANGTITRSRVLFKCRKHNPLLWQELHRDIEKRVDGAVRPSQSAVEREKGDYFVSLAITISVMCMQYPGNQGNFKTEQTLVNLWPDKAVQLLICRILANVHCAKSV